ncbi:MAG: caspase family protein, partial [Planctomycetia bacterium]|nr:caspase family protein [Planctomycetia bacterium]
MEKMKKRALLFGINGYRKLPELHYAQNDALGVANALKTHYQFSENEVVVLASDRDEPDSKEDILERLEWSESLDLLIVGFWGHGVWRGKKRYLCPRGTRLERIEDTALTLEDLRDAVQRIPAKNICIILDCCQSQVDARMAEVPTLEVGARNIVMEIFDPKKSDRVEEVQEQTVAILNSCSEGELAYEWDEKSHGFFTHHLIEALQRGETEVTKIFSYVREETKKSADLKQKKQVPFYECLGGAEIILPAADIILPAIQTKTFYVPENPNNVKITTHEI